MDDDYFDVFAMVCFCVFAVEIVLSTIGKEDYFMGFFFTYSIDATIYR